MLKIDIEKALHGFSGEMKLDVDIKIADGEFIALAGQSGSGKTTLLRIIAGLESPESGSMSMDGVKWYAREGRRVVVLEAQRRGVGFVFQDYALFPNMTVLENLLFVKKDRALAAKMLELVELEELRSRYPATLSGGQKQRVALVRSLMNRPKILLLDEPLSALDPSMRTKLQDELLRIHKEFEVTTIMVSHDPSEIYRIADRVIVLQNGVVVKEGTPRDVLLRSSGSQKFSFDGEILEITKADVLNVAVIAIGNQIVEVVLNRKESEKFRVGDRVKVGAKAFAPNISRVTSGRIEI